MVSRAAPAPTGRARHAPQRPSRTASTRGSAVVPPLVLPLLFLSLLAALPSCAHAGISIKNNCRFTMFVSARSGVNPIFKYTLAPGASQFLNFGPANLWPNGIIWGSRTGSLNPGQTTLVEFNIGAYQGTDFYDVSVVDAYNLPVSIKPINPPVTPNGNTCGSPSCNVGDIKTFCKSPNYLTTADPSCKNTDGPGLFATAGTKAFKAKCPKVYTYSKDDLATYGCPTGTNFGWLEWGVGRLPSIGRCCSFRALPAPLGDLWGPALAASVAVSALFARIVQIPGWGRGETMSACFLNFGPANLWPNGIIWGSRTGSLNPGQTTLVEFNIGAYQGTDFYDVSVVDAYNLPVSIKPINPPVTPNGNTCGSPSCNVGDIKTFCKSPNYLTTADPSCKNTDGPGLFATAGTKAFKAKCPKVYTYSKDDLATYGCPTGTNYRGEARVMGRSVWKSGVNPIFKYTLAPGASQFLNFGPANLWPNGIIWGSRTGSLNPGQTTLVEFNIGAYQGTDFYDVSVVDAYNLPVSIKPINPPVTPNGNTCGSPSCNVGDIKTFCKSPNYLTTADPSCKNTDGPGLFATAGTKAFKAKCPKVYTYSKDDLATYGCPTGTNSVVPPLGLPLLFLSLLAALPSCAHAGISIKNNCRFTMFVSARSGVNPIFKYTLAPGASQFLNFGPANLWPNGIIWGSRTGSLNPGQTTLVEFNIGAYQGTDFYDVSVVDAYNLPVSIKPINPPVTPNGNTCGSPSCNVGDIKTFCKSPNYLTTADPSCKNTDGPGLFATAGTKAFKAKCPKVYTYSKDDLATYGCPTGTN
ncbi:Pathogenesis-related protein, partial [Tetrabaena socialis]